MAKSIFGLGIDQGIANCGYAVVELTENDEIKLIKSGTIITTTKQELPQRVERIYNTIKDLIEEYNVSILGCEKLFFSPKQKSATNTKGRNKSASIVYTNMITGVLYLLAGQSNVYLKEFVPGTVKKYVAGHGRANKDDVKEAVELIVKSLEKELETEHESDSIAIAITGVRFKRDLELQGLEKEVKKKKPRAKAKAKESDEVIEKPKRKKRAKKGEEVIE